MRGALHWFAISTAVFSVAFPLLISFYFYGWSAPYRPLSKRFTFADIPNLQGKVAIVTGGTTGLGYVTVRELVKKGASVVLTGRTDAKGQAAVERMTKELSVDTTISPGQVEYLNLDLSDMNSVKSFAKQFKRSYRKLDMLILNAGVAVSPYSTTAQGLELQIGTNHFGHFLLVKQLLQLISKSNARVVHVSSIAHEGTYPDGGLRFDQFDGDKNYNRMFAYGQSKLANILFSNELARVLEESGSRATSNALHPGMVKTELGRHAEDMIAKSPLLRLMWPLFFVVSLAQMDVDTGALTQLYLATSPEVQGLTGKYFTPVGVESKPSAFALDVKLQKKLWEESEQRTKKFQ